MIVFFNLRGLVGIVLAWAIATVPVLVAEVSGHGFSDEAALMFMPVAFGLFSSLYAFTYDRCDRRGLVGSYWLNMKNFLYATIWQHFGAPWADPHTSKFVVHPQRRLCYAICPLALNVYLVVLVSAVFWFWRISTDDLSTTHAQHFRHLLVCVVAAIFATLYALATRDHRLIPPLAEQEGGG
ncbi:MAG: hypothetical protein K8T91_22210 [Planctomycetes bacterium]|nr:hypothetical protein [Planctomycetota bacterium]